MEPSLVAVLDARVLPHVDELGEGTLSTLMTGEGRDAIGNRTPLIISAPSKRALMLAHALSRNFRNAPVVESDLLLRKYAEVADSPEELLASVEVSNKNNYKVFFLVVEP